MTRDYSIIVPLMISNLISFFVSYRLQRQPIYEALAHQEGVFLPTGESRDHLARRVSDVIESGRTIAADTVLATITDQLRGSGRNVWPVTDDGHLIGVLTGSVWEQAPAGATAAQVARADYIYVHPDQLLSLALEKMGEHHLDLLPVVSRADVTKLLGVVTLPSVLNAYGIGVALPDSTEAL